MHCPVSPILLFVCFLIQISWDVSRVFTCVEGYNVHINLYGDYFLCKHIQSQEKRHRDVHCIIIIQFNAAFLSSKILGLYVCGGNWEGVMIIN